MAQNDLFWVIFDHLFNHLICVCLIWTTIACIFGWNMKRGPKGGPKMGHFGCPEVRGTPKSWHFGVKTSNLAFWGVQKWPIFGQKVVQKWVIFWTLFLSFLTPFHVEGSYLVVREMAQKWAKNGPIFGPIFWPKIGQFLANLTCQIWHFVDKMSSFGWSREVRDTPGNHFLDPFLAVCRGTPYMDPWNMG